MWLPFGIGQQPCGGVWSGKNQIKEKCVTKESVPAKINSQTVQKVCTRLQPKTISKCDSNCSALDSTDCPSECDNDCLRGLAMRWPTSEFPPTQTETTYVGFNNYKVPAGTEQEPSYKVFSQCGSPKYGFKAIQASKNFQGRFGFKHNDICDEGNGTSDRIKFRTSRLSISAEVAFRGVTEWDSAECGTPQPSSSQDTSGTDSWYREVSVSKNSGEPTYTDCGQTAGIRNDDDDYDYPKIFEGFFERADGIPYSHFISPNVVPNYPEDGDSHLRFTLFKGIEADGCGIRIPKYSSNYIEYSLMGTEEDFVGNETQLEDLILTKSFYDIYFEDVGLEPAQSCDVSWSNDRIHIVYTVDVSGYYTGDYAYCWNTSIYTGTLRFELDYQLSDSYDSSSGQELQVTDLMSQLNQWDITDDHVYPWRTDDYISVAPLVERDEAAYGFPAIGFSCSTTNTPVYQGYLLGEDAPITSTNVGHFDFFHKTWMYCNASYCPKYLGARSAHNSTGDDQSDLVVPNTATHWTEDYDARYIWGGAWAFNERARYNYLTANGYLSSPDRMIMQKWIEIITPHPFHDFNRPNAADKFAFDETLVYHADLSSPNNYTLTNLDTSAVTVDPGVGIGLWGGSVVGGFFSGCSFSGGIVTLGTKILTYPNGLTSRNGDSGAFGKLRFSTSATNIAGISGRVEIANITEDNHFNTLTPQPYFAKENTGGTKERVFFYDANMVVVDEGAVPNEGREVTRISDNEFSVVGFYTEEAKAKAKYMVVKGVDWMWSNTRPCGWFVTAGIESFERENDQSEHDLYEKTLTQQCYPPSATDYHKVIIAPSGSTEFGKLSNVTEIEFPSFTPDWRYGKHWFGLVIQAMPDPLWQVPARPYSADTFLWTEDCGTCAADVGGQYYPTRYYPARPYVEALLQSTYETWLTRPQGLLTNVPALPSGITLIEDVGLPSNGGVWQLLPATGTNSWSLELNKRNCICEAGRFSEQYLTQELKCEDC